LNDSVCSYRRDLNWIQSIHLISSAKWRIAYLLIKQRLIWEINRSFGM